MKKVLIAVAVIILIVLGWKLMSKKGDEVVVTPTPTPTTSSTVPVVEEDKTETIIGKSVEGRDITAYHFGTGDRNVLFVGGIHGGYSWNTSMVARELMDYLKANPTAVPANMKVTVIPVLNPDGLNKVVDPTDAFVASDIKATQAVQISGRYNANKVDLNRNFDCQWQATGKWQTTTVSGGTAAFSEPETLALKNYVESSKPVAAVVWYSSAGGVYASACGGTPSAETTALTNLYAQASGYKAYPSFDYYETSGDMVNWLAKGGVPAISVLLTDHTSTEWSKNQKGIEAVLSNYAK
jgi:hypothetical protein